MAQSRTWVREMVVAVVNGGVTTQHPIEIYIEHEFETHRHRLVVDGDAGAWFPIQQIAVCQEYRAVMRKHHLNMPEIFTINTAGFRKID